MPQETLNSALFDYIVLVEKRPGMHIGSKRVYDLFLHLGGWWAHGRLFEDNDQFADHFFEEFHGFVGRHYKDRRSIGWAGLIQENSGSEEEEFPIFMEFLRRFAAEFSARSG
ncbi:MAG TPA: hypothetical protein VK862_12180 [Afifellaceae bacterium]|nr:hypothetical protein [Afifellaceae bacterium]